MLRVLERHVQSTVSCQDVFWFKVVSLSQEPRPLRMDRALDLGLWFLPPAFTDSLTARRLR